MVPRGIGLTRTEHMFFDEERLPIVQEMILADSAEARKEALDKLLPMQKADFKEILKVMGERPVTIRLLDPPLHEFLPDYNELLVEITELKAKGGDASEIEEKEALLKKIDGTPRNEPDAGPSWLPSGYDLIRKSRQCRPGLSSKKQLQSWLKKVSMFILRS